MSPTDSPTPERVIVVRHEAAPTPPTGIFEKELAGVIVEAMKRTMASRDAKIAALEQKVKELEARPVTKDAGVWNAGTLYHAGALVSHGGSGWICSVTHVASGTEPSHECFRLLVKRGADGKSAR